MTKAPIRQRPWGRGNRTTYERLPVSLLSKSVHLQINTFILRKVVENHFDVCGLSRLMQNRRFEISLFTLRDPAPLRIMSCKDRQHTYRSFHKIPDESLSGQVAPVTDCLPAFFSSIPI